MALQRILAIVGLLGLLSGCTPPGVSGTGSAQVVLPAARHIQYVSSDVKLLKVTVTAQPSGQTYVKAFPGTSLVATAGGSQFQFLADNLPPGSYVAKLQAYMDTAGTSLLGSSTSAAFLVTAFSTTPVTLPNLVLAATPTGDWQHTVGVSLSASYVVSDYTAQLTTPDGSTIAGPAGSTLAATNTFTWGNVAAYPPGESTSSITITATNKKGKFITKTQIATTSILANATQVSAFNFVFP